MLRPQINTWQSAWVIRSFYKFVQLDDNATRRQRLLGLCTDAGVLGTILLATEGINASLAGYTEALDKVMAGLQADPPLANLNWRESYAPQREPPFQQLKIVHKKQILSFPLFLEPQDVPINVQAKHWNALLAQDNILLLDVRNNYESDAGMFANASTPDIDNFAQLPQYLRTNFDTAPQVAMYCTGGIRCEKASQWMLAEGLAKKVYQLEGGIISYLQQISAKTSKWQGECFVFDDRLKLNCGSVEAIEESKYKSQGKKLSFSRKNT